MTKETMLRYQCFTCGNTCLTSTPPDNTICGGCNNPDWKLLKLQESYKIGGVDFEHPSGHDSLVSQEERLLIKDIISTVQIPNFLKI